MNTEFATLANDAAEIETSGRWHAVKARVKFLAQNPGSGNGWWVQLFGGLCCQTFSEYLALKYAYQKKQGDAALLAWRARNLLELSVWATYCTNSRENARLLSQEALSDGTESLEGSYKGVRAAAEECGIGERFSLSYKMLSKFAHPTAMQIVAAANEAREILQRDILYGEGCRFFSGAFNALERQLLAQTYDPVGTVVVNQDGSQREDGGAGGAAQAEWGSAARCGYEEEVTVYG